MTRDEALRAVLAVHAYAPGAVQAGEAGRPSLQERAWAQALEVDCPSATVADAITGARRAAVGHPRPTLADLVRETLRARDERRRVEATTPAPDRPALAAPRPDDMRDEARAATIRRMLAEPRWVLALGDDELRREIEREADELLAVGDVGVGHLDALLRGIGARR